MNKLSSPSDKTPRVPRKRGAPAQQSARARRPARSGPRESTEIRFAQVLELLAGGASKRAACAKAGLSRSKLDDLAADPARGALVQTAVDQGLALLEGRVLEAATVGDWRAAIRLLEQRDPRSWSARAQLEVAAKVETTATLQGVIVSNPRIEAMRANPCEREVLDYFLDVYAGVIPRPDWRITRMVSHPDSARELRELLDRDEERQERERAVSTIPQPAALAAPPKGPR